MYLFQFTENSFRVDTTTEKRMQNKLFCQNSILLSVSNSRKDILSLKMTEEKVSVC